MVAFKKKIRLTDSVCQPQQGQVSSFTKKTVITSIVHILWDISMKGLIFLIGLKYRELGLLVGLNLALAEVGTGTGGTYPAERV